MRVSFVGTGKRLSVCYNLFKDRTGFEISGFYWSDINECAQVAIQANAKLYQSLDSLYTDSDVIVIATADKAVPKVISALSRLHAHGKVFVTISPRLTSPELSIAYPNACAIINSIIPFEHMTESQIGSASIICEVFGKNYSKFCETLKQSSDNCCFVNSKQLQSFRTGLHFAKFGTIASVLASMQMMKISGVSYNPDFLIPVLNDSLRFINYGKELRAGTPYEDAQLNEIRKHKTILSENGIESSERFYDAIALMLTEHSCTDNEAADEVIRLVNNF